MLHKRIPLAVITAAAGVAAATAVPAFAKNPHSGSHGNSGNAHVHVTICHAAPPDTFPASHYVRISPSASGVYHGHLRQHTADIIPPFTYNGQTYSANWDATGQAIWNNGCAAPSSSTTTTTTTTSGGSSSGTAGSSSSGSSSAGGTSSVASASSSATSGVKGVTHPARPARARTSAASFAG